MPDLSPEERRRRRREIDRELALRQKAALPQSQRRRAAQIVVISPAGKAHLAWDGEDRPLCIHYGDEGIGGWDRSGQNWDDIARPRKCRDCIELA